VKKYSSIKIEGTYLDLISKIEPNEFSLLKRDHQNYLLGWDLKEKLILDNNHADFLNLDNFISENAGDYIFGLISYDLKNSIYQELSSENVTHLAEEKSTFSTFNNLIICNAGQLMYFGDENKVAEVTSFFENVKSSQDSNTEFELRSSEDQKTYVDKIDRLKSLIQRGDIYEVNYCTAFHLHNKEVDSKNTFQKIQTATQAPYGAFVKSGDFDILCGSPERFLKKKENKLYSQPIKGTAKRSENQLEDERLIKNLKSSIKEQAENVMIVDLVRNDLSKIATKNSVLVEELSKLYSFKSVHQLISTVSCQVNDSTTFTDILKATFPMGSMTGAPKMNAMKFAESHEDFKRGYYSGAIGIIEPNGNFDFNVIIRSLIYNKSSHNSKVGVGGAITILSDNHAEYEECLTKLKAIKDSVC